MRRFDMEASELNGVFKADLTGGFADKVLDSLPIWKASASMAREACVSVSIDFLPIEGYVNLLFG
jgi:hypothetical protein